MRKDVSSNIRSKIILIGGPPGSGKTHFGKELSREISSVYLDKDTVSRHFTERMLEILGSHRDDRESDIYRSEVRDLEYDVMLKSALENLGLGHDVVCTAPFLKEFGDEFWIEEMRVEAELADAQCLFIWIHTDERTTRQRLIYRGANRDNEKLSNWDSYVKGLGEMPPRGCDDLIAVDNTSSSSASLLEQVQGIVEMMKQRDRNA